MRPEEDFRRGGRLGARRFDRGYTGLEFADGVARASLGTASGTSSVWFDDAFTCLQAYTVDEVAAGQAGVAFEPMSCAPDAFNSGDGLIVLEPAGTWTGHWGVDPDR